MKKTINFLIVAFLCVNISATAGDVNVNDVINRSSEMPVGSRTVYVDKETMNKLTKESSHEFTSIMRVFQNVVAQRDADHAAWNKKWDSCNRICAVWGNDDSNRNACMTRAGC